MILLYDLVLNDDSIFKEAPFHARDTIANDNELMDKLYDSLIKGNLAMPQEGSLRECILNILFRVYQRRPELKVIIEPVVYQHLANLTEACKTMPERAEALQDEIEVAKKVLNAPL